MPDSAANPADVFRRLGLRPPGFWRSIAVPPRGGGSGPGEKLRDAFEQLGGLYPAFARFLLWRADLLGTEYLTSLRQVRVAIAPEPRDSVIALLSRELGLKSYELVREMETEPVWSTISRTAYCSKYRGGKVVVQIARQAVPDSAFEEFESGVRHLGHPDIGRITSTAVLREFRQWVRQAESPVREKSFLEVLNRQKGETLAEYPAPIAEITTGNILCWPWVDGEPVSDLIQWGSFETVAKMAAAVLEQFCCLAVVDAELDLDAMVIGRDTDGTKRLVVRRINRAVSVPPALVNVGIKYVAAVLEGDAAITVRTLLAMAAARAPGQLEPVLLNLLSGIEPELKVHLWYPGAAAAFESNWRALAKLDIARPLYLNCLHRNLIALGYWNAEAVSRGGARGDAIVDAQWPVVGRLLRTQSSQFLDPAVAGDWAVGTGLLLLGTMREANRVAEEIRENNLSMGVEITAENGDSQRHANRTVRMGVLIGALLVTLLVSVRVGSTLHSTAAAFALAIAVSALVGLFWVVSRIG